MTDIVFQILDILSRDELITSENEDTIVVSYDTVNNDYSDDENERSKMPKTQALRSQLLIHLFGRTVTGKRVRVDVEGFCPYFYVEAPILTTGQLRIAQQQLKDYIGKCCKFASHVTIGLEFREKFYGFTNHMNFPFFKLTVKSMQHFYNLRQLFLNKENNHPQIKGIKIGTLWTNAAPAVYESHLDPMLRFLHTQNIQPCGWITVKDVKEDDFTDDALRCNYTDCLPAAAPAAAAPFVTVSWDIECFSGSGDFPLAKKDYKKVAKDIYAIATSGAHAVELIDQAMLWLNEGDVLSESAGRPITPIQCKNKLSPDARRVFLAGMNQVKIYNELEKYLKESPLDKDEAIEGLTDSLNKILGTRFPVAGDPIIQIGASIAAGEKHIFVYPSCDPIDDTIVHVSPNEAAMLVDWFKWMEIVDPDILLGYNIFGFDEKYVWQRVEELGLQDDVSLQAFNRLSADGGVMKCEESFLSSSALGDNVLNMWTTQGRLQIDLYHYVKRTMQLASYKLDDVAASLMSGALVSIESPDAAGQIELTLKGAVKDIRVGRALKLLDESNEAISAKLEVISVAAGGKITVSSPPMDEDEWIALKADAESWVIVKDDVSPADIFRFHCGSSADRAKVAKYCIQDCDLVIELYKKLETFMNAMAMANVCSVPVRFIFTRGQGIKIESLIAKECLELNKCIVTLPAPSRSSTEASYEGAIVLDPIPSFYNKSPIGVGDFASLYPSTIISENISHDTLVWVRDFDDDGYLIKHVWGSDVYDELEDVDYTDIKFDLLIPDPEDHRKTPQKIKAGNRICRYAQNSAGTLPIILKKLLAARKAKRNEAAKETDLLRQILLDTEQLAYKLTANSLYGQLGSGTFKMRLQDLAASTTAYGRLQIMFAKAVIEQFYGPSSGNPRCEARSNFVGHDGKEITCEANIMYGDSVTGNTALFINGGELGPRTIRIDEIGGQWTAYHNTKEAIELEGLQVWTERGFTPIKRIIRHRLHPDKKLYRILTHSGVVDATEDHSLVLTDGSECRPADVAVGTELLHNHSAASVYPILPITVSEGTRVFKDKVSAHELYIAALQQGYYVEFISYIGDEIVINITTSNSITNKDTIKIIYELPHPEEAYVYDLETENHHFAVGPGALVVHNTDSLFIEFNPRDPITGERLKDREAREAVIDLTTEAGHLVSHALKPPHDFEFDKVFDPMLMFSKKRYAGKMYESNPDDFVYKYMGIVLKRRDNAPIVKKIYGNAMKKVLDEGDVAGATKYVQDAALELVTGTTSLGLLTITKSLRAEYANPDRIAHKVLADRMTVRDPGTAPAAGDRIGYVYVKPPPGQIAAKKQGDRIETPAYVKSTPGVELDAVYYIDHQIKVPVSQMFGLLLEQMPEYERTMLPSNYDELDMEHQMALRENVASNILFTPAISHASMLEKRRVMTKMFGLSASAPSKPTRQKIVTQATEPKKPMKQSRLTNYFENREILAVVKRMSKKGGGSGSDSSSAGSR